MGHPDFCPGGRPAKAFYTPRSRRKRDEVTYDGVILPLAFLTSAADAPGLISKISKGSNLANKDTAQQP